MEEVCRRCNKPKQRAAAGSITQWIALCDCESLKSAQTEEMQKLSVHICADCGKRIVGKERSGSFTQWVFRSDVCCCNQPRVESDDDDVPTSLPTGGWLAARLRNQEQKDRERALKDIAPQDRALIDVDPTLFPQDRYVPLELLGAGAEGNVYLCCDLLLSKNVAVKTLHVLDGQQLMAFQQEARATSRLNHPNIVTTLDFGATADGKPYMVMELSSGISLAQYLEANGPLSEELAVVLFEKICLALQYAHDKGVYHRDLKPSNFVILENAGQPDIQVIDFGVAQIKHERQEPTIVQGRTVAGTPAYMSPDQVSGLPYDARSEIYALGCVMFEALTGRVPFLGDTSMETLTMHANAPPPALSDFQDEISEELDAIVLTCLAKEPDERFQSMQELASGLQRLQERRTERVQTEGEAPERRNSKSMVLPAVLIFGLIVPLIAWFALQAVNSSNEEAAPKSAKTWEPFATMDLVKSDEQDMFYKIDKVADDYVVTVQASGGVQLVIAHKMTMKDVAEIKQVIKERKVTQLCFNLAELDAELFEPFSTEMSLDLLMIDHNMFDEKMFEIISRMRNLRTICIAHASPVPTAGLAHLKKLKYLASLIMPYARCQPDAIKEISQIRSLEFLNMAYCPIGKYQDEIGQLQLLRSLNVRGTGCDDGLTRFLPKLTKLTNLTVSDNKGITGATLVAVKDKPLGFLSVGSTSIRQPDLECIRHMPLQILEVGRLGLDDSALRYFVGLKKLERLSIAHNKFTDKTLFRLAMIDTLKGVEVSGNPVTELGVNALSSNGREIVSDPKEPFPLGDEFSDVPVWNMPD